MTEFVYMRPHQREESIEFLKRFGGSSKVMVEIGTFAGEFACMAAPFFKTVHCVDPWDFDGLVTVRGPNEDGLTGEQIEKAFDANTAEFPNIIKHKGYDHEVVGRFPLASVDLLYIDSEHTFVACGATALRWWPILKPDGVLGGHDYGNDGYPEVKQVVDILADMLKIQLVTAGDRSWALPLVMSRGF